MRALARLEPVAGHSTISEAWAAVAVLNDDAALFGKAAALHRATLGAYTRWGFDPATSGSRVIGECTETLRDVYHTLFGLGGLLQVSEWAWQQNRDLFSASNYALVAAMELHARIINAWDAGQSEALLPPGFRFYEKSMPAPPPGCEWVSVGCVRKRVHAGGSIDTRLVGTRLLLLCALTVCAGHGRAPPDMVRARRAEQGVGVRPAGWREVHPGRQVATHGLGNRVRVPLALRNPAPVRAHVARMLSRSCGCRRARDRYNHFWGRLGIQMPETAALIKRYPLESHDFHWGQGTLTHADTASVLWRPGLSSASLCA